MREIASPEFEEGGIEHKPRSLIWVDFGMPGHESEYVVGTALGEPIHKDIALELQGELGEEWEVSHRGTRLEIHNKKEYGTRDDIYVISALHEVLGNFSEVRSQEWDKVITKVSDIWGGSMGMLLKDHGDWWPHPNDRVQDSQQLKEAATMLRELAYDAVSEAETLNESEQDVDTRMKLTEGKRRVLRDAIREVQKARGYTPMKGD